MLAARSSCTIQSAGKDVAIPLNSGRELIGIPESPAAVADRQSQRLQVHWKLMLPLLIFLAWFACVLVQDIVMLISSSHILLTQSLTCFGRDVWVTCFAPRNRTWPQEMTISYHFKIRNILFQIDQPNPCNILLGFLLGFQLCFFPAKIEASILFRGLQLLIYWPFGYVAYALLRHVDSPMLSLGQSLVLVVCHGGRWQDGIMDAYTIW